MVMVWLDVLYDLLPGSHDFLHFFRRSFEPFVVCMSAAGAHDNLMSLSTNLQMDKSLNSSDLWHRDRIDQDHARMTFLPGA